jgi:hypothetical protein
MLALLTAGLLLARPVSGAQGPALWVHREVHGLPPDLVIIYLDPEAEEAVQPTVTVTRERAVEGGAPLQAVEGGAPEALGGGPEPMAVLGAAGGAALALSALLCLLARRPQGPAAACGGRCLGAAARWRAQELRQLVEEGGRERRRIEQEVRRREEGERGCACTDRYVSPAVYV